MKYSSRNSVVISVIIFIILVGSGVYFFFNNRKFKKLEAQNVKIQNEINTMQSSFLGEDSSVRIKDTLDDLLFRVKMNNKVLLKIEDSKLTYNYLTKISKRFTPTLAFNFLNESKKDKKGKKEAVYEISGSASAWNLFKFLYHIEYQAPLYTIEELKFSEFTESKRDRKFQEYVNFRFQLKGHSNESGIGWDEIILKEEDTKIYSHNVFKKRLYAPRVLEEEEKYPKIENASLLSITTDNAVIINGDKTYTLLPNDRVAYGFLKEIDWKNQCAIFTINKIGITQEKVLKFDGKLDEDKK